MHAKPDLRVVLKWTIAGSGSVIADVIPLGLMQPESHKTVRGCMLLSTPLDLRATTEALIRNYELVRKFAHQICPTLPTGYSIRIVAGATSHSGGKIPLLGFWVPENLPDAEFPDIQQNIDDWFQSLDANTIESMLRNIECPTWDTILETGIYPNAPD